jgi:hypothetical protein
MVAPLAPSASRGSGRFANRNNAKTNDPAQARVFAHTAHDASRRRVPQRAVPPAPGSISSGRRSHELASASEVPCFTTSSRFGQGSSNRRSGRRGLSDVQNRSWPGNHRPVARGNPGKTHPTRHELVCEAACHVIASGRWLQADDAAGWVVVSDSNVADQARIGVVCESSPGCTPIAEDSEGAGRGSVSRGSAGRNAAEAAERGSWRQRAVLVHLV